MRLRAKTVALRQAGLGSLSGCGADRSTRQLGQGGLIHGHRAVFLSRCGYFENRAMAINIVVMSTNSHTTWWDSALDTEPVVKRPVGFAQVYLSPRQPI